MEYGAKREDILLQPVSGKALPVYRGEVLRIIQVDGEQCVDFNAFNLHDYKEYMSTSNTRRAHGFRVKQGDLIWSVQSRDRPMFCILEMPDTCATDLLSGRCKASRHYPEGFTPEEYGIHTNCQDTIAACIGEYGLTPDDVHDSCNLWMNTQWDSNGRTSTLRNMGRKADCIDLLSLFDTLSVPVICGGADSNNFSYKPIQIQVYKASAQTEALVASLERRHGPAQRTLKDFRIKEIKAKRELRHDPNYVPEFVNFPMKTRRIAVQLSQTQYAGLQTMKKLLDAKDDGACLRTAFFLWYDRNRRKAPLRSTLRLT